jgi:methylated-DNA-[protein]-cysteine S-methyltransferase
MIITTPTGTVPFFRRFDSPIGRIEVSGDADAITSLSIEADGRLPHDGVPERANRVTNSAARQLCQYFAGTRRRFDVPIALIGTEFQKAVWGALAAIDFGEVSSYGDIGRATGRRTAGRAVGGAVSANPIPILVPCHRVLAIGGRITGYSRGEGIPTKAWLLDHEGIIHSTRATRVG